MRPKRGGDAGKAADCGYILPSQLDAQLLETHATSLYRTQQTLQNILLGLYPESARPEGPGSKITTVCTRDPVTHEYMYPNWRFCPMSQKIFKTETSLRSGKAKSMLSFEEIYTMRRLVQLFDYPSVEEFPYSSVRSTLHCLRAHGRPLPIGVSPDDVDTITSLSARLEYYRFAHPLGFRISMGLLCKRMFDALRPRSASPSLDDGGRKTVLTIFSGHDSSVKPLATMLGIISPDHWPPYTASILLELGEEDETGNQFVRVVYDRNVAQVQNLKMDSRGWMRWEDFRSYMEPMTMPLLERSSSCGKASLINEGE